MKLTVVTSVNRTNEIAKHFWEADDNFSWDQKKAVDAERSKKPYIY